MAVGEKFNPHATEGAMKSDFSFHHLAGDGLDELVKHEIGIKAVVLGLGVGNPAGKMRHLNQELSIFLQDAVDLSKNSVKIPEMLQDMLGDDPVDRVILNGIRKLIQIKNQIRLVVDVNIHAVGVIRFIGAAAKVKGENEEILFVLKLSGSE